jgi:hypothetical protein
MCDTRGDAPARERMNCLSEILRPTKKAAVYRQSDACRRHWSPTTTQTSARLDVISDPILRRSISKVTNRCLTDRVINTLRPFNRALSPAEVAQLYRLGSVIIRP